MFILKHRRFILFFCLLLILVAGYFATKVYFYHDLDRFLPKDRTDNQFLTHFQEQLEPDDTYYLVGLHEQNGIFKQPFLTKLDSFTRQVKSLENIEKVTSIATLRLPLRTPFAMTTVPLLHINEPLKYRQDSIAIFKDERILNRFVSESGKTTMVVLKTRKDLEQFEAEHLDQSVQSLLKEFEFEEWHVTGKANIQTGFVSLIQNELFFYIIACNLFLVLVLFFIFRRFWTVALALFSVVLGAFFFIGILGAIGIPLDLMSMLFPPLMLIVGMSDVIHFLTKYMDELKAGEEKEKAMLKTIREIGWATLLTSVTTAVGFSALYFSKIEPIREFGINAAVGVFVAYLTVLFFTTSALLFIPPEKLISKRRAYSWDKILNKNYFFIQNNPRRILLATLGILVICAIGLSKISTNAFVLSDVPDNCKMMDDVRFFDRELSGVRSYELAILPQGDFKIFDYEVLQEIDKLETHLKDNVPVKSILSPLSTFKSMNKAWHYNKPEYYQLPDQKAYQKYHKQINKISSSEINVLVSKDKKLGRLTGRMVDMGSDVTSEMNKKVMTWIDDNLQAEVVRFRPTGTSLVIDKNNEYLRQSLLQSLVFALGVVSILMAFLFKDIRLVIISLIPNIIPLILTAAIIGFMNIELKGSTSIIFAIAFGIAVDDTIHFLSKFKHERDLGHSIRLSIYNTFMETGKAIILTTIILFFGFSLLIFSNFNGVYYVGFLISLSLLAALASCLFLLPIFLLWILGGRKETLLPENLQSASSLETSNQIHQ